MVMSRSSPDFETNKGKILSTIYRKCLVLYMGRFVGQERRKGLDAVKFVLNDSISQG